MTIVGYGTSESSKIFYIVKNSWGPDWGESGYFRIFADACMIHDIVCSVSVGPSCRKITASTYDFYEVAVAQQDVGKNLLVIAPDVSGDSTIFVGVDYKPSSFHYDYRGERTINISRIRRGTYFVAVLANQDSCYSFSAVVRDAS